MNIKDFFLEDWRNIPQNYRYFFLAGFILIGLTWLKDHWENFAESSVNPPGLDKAGLIYYPVHICTG